MIHSATRRLPALLAAPLAVLTLANTASAQDINTSFLGQNGWFSDDTRADGSGAFPPGTNLVSPTLTDAPEGADPLKFNPAHDADILQQILFQPAPGAVPSGTWLGSVRLTIDPGDGGAGKSTISHRKDDGIGHAPGSLMGPAFTAEYSWMGNGPPTMTASLKLGFKTSEFGSLSPSPRTGEGSWDKLMIYEPNQGNGKISNGLWLTETIDYTSGRWWVVDRTIPGGFSIGTPRTLEELSTSTITLGASTRTLADFYALVTGPGSILTNVQFGVGSGNSGANVYVNQLTMNGYRGGQVTTFGPLPPFAAVDIPVGTAPAGLTLADLNDSGRADIATADSGSDTVTVLLNDGDGNFPSSNTVPLNAGDAPAAVVAYDGTGLGVMDLAVAAQGGNRVVILANNGLGDFVEIDSLSTLPATQPVSLAAGDLNASGAEDLVVAMQGELLAAGTGSVAVSLNGGALAALPAPTGGFLRPQRVALADLDLDGDLDIVVTMAGTTLVPSGSDNVLLYENLGAGTFAAPITLSVSQNPKAVAVADLDGNGYPDLVVSAESFPFVVPGNLRVWRNDGLTAGAWSSGDFSSGGTFSAGVLPQALAVGDLLDDSLPGFISRQDVVAANFGGGDASWLAAYDGGTSSFEGISSLTAGTAPSAIGIAHLDGDRTPDVVIANLGDDSVTVLLSLTPTLAQNFGSGCPGTAGLVPAISAVGSPSLGNSGFAVALSDARPFSPCFLAISAGQIQFPLGGACTLYLDPPLVLVTQVTNFFGATQVPVPVPPPSPGLLGASIYFQYAVFDPAGLGVLGTAVSDALRVKLGN